MKLISTRMTSAIRFLNPLSFTRSMSKLPRTSIVRREEISSAYHDTIFNHHHQPLSSTSYNFYRRMSSSSVPEISVKVENLIRTITIDRQSKRNAINGSMYRALNEAFRSVNEDESTNLVVLTGKGDYYTAGNDIKDLNSIKTMDYKHFIDAVIDCKKPVFMLVNGHAIGIGVTLMGLADAVYSTDKATFLTPFSRLGICAEGCSSYTFPRIMGYAKASELLYFSTKITAQQALDWGLVSIVFPDSEFEEKAWAKVHEIAQLPIKSLICSKELVRGRERELLHAVNDKEADALQAIVLGATKSN